MLASQVDQRRTSIPGFFSKPQGAVSSPLEFWVGISEFDLPPPKKLSPPGKFPGMGKWDFVTGPCPFAVGLRFPRHSPSREFLTCYRPTEVVVNCAVLFFSCSRIHTHGERSEGGAVQLPTNNLLLTQSRGLIFFFPRTLEPLLRARATQGRF